MPKNASDRSSSALALRCAVVFDFDETLAIDTARADDDASTIFGGAERITQLCALCAELRLGGLTLAVCSYNYRSIFEPLMQEVGLLDFFDRTLLFGAEAFEEMSSASRCDPDKGDMIRDAIVGRFLQTDDQESELLAELALPQTPRVILPRIGTIDESEDGTSMILFVDDQADNIHDVRRACPACATLLVPSDATSRSLGGLQATQLDVIRVWARAANPGSEFDVFDDPSPV